MATTITQAAVVSSSIASSASFGDLLVKSQPNGTTVATDDFGLTITSDQGWYALQVNSPYENPLRVRSTDGTGGIDIGDNSSTNNYNRIQVTGNDRMEFYVNNVEMMELQAGEITINQGGANINTRIEGDNDENLLFIDAGQDAIGIGKGMNVGDEKFYVGGDVGITGSLHVSGNITTSGSIIAKEFRTEFVNQVVTQASGSTEFGDGIGDLHKFTGSLEVSGGISLPDYGATLAEISLGNGGDGKIYSHNDDLYIGNETSDKDVYIRANDGGVHGTAIHIDASAVRSVFLPNDNQVLGIGAGNDLRFWHDGTNSNIYNYVGELRIGNNTNDSDVIIYCDDQSGGNAEYVKLDGSVGDLLLTPPSGKISGSLISTGSFGKIVAPGGAKIGPSFDFSSGGTLTVQSHGIVNWDAGDFRVYGKAGKKLQLGSMNTFGVLTVSSSHADTMVISGSNVGIGAVSPSTKLHIGGAPDGRTITFDQSGRRNGIGSYFAANASDSQLWFYVSDGGTDGDTNIKMKLYASGDLCINDGGVSGSLTSTGSFGALQIADRGNSFTLGGHAGLARMTYGGAFFQFTDGDNSYSSIAVDSGSFNGDIFIRPTLKLYFDAGGGGPYTAGHTYISEASADILDFYVGGSHMFRMDEGNNVVSIPKDADEATFKMGVGGDLEMYVESGGSDTAIIRSKTGDFKIMAQAADADMQFFCDDGSGGDDEYLRLDGGATALDMFVDTRLAAAKKLFFDGGGNTYIQESATDILDFYAGGAHMLSLDETNDEAVFNEGSDNLDLRVESNGQSHMLFVDGGNDTVGVKAPVGTQSASFQVGGGIIRTVEKTDGILSTTQETPVGHYTTGDEVFSIDPTWSNDELRAFMGRNNQSFTASHDAPGGYAIYVDGYESSFREAGAGMPVIPIQQGDVYHMEIWMKNIGTDQLHYVGVQEMGDNFQSTGGNPGSYAYFVMSNTNATANWSYHEGYISGSHITNKGNFETSSMYMSPLSLFNYTAGSGTRACVYSGWRMRRVSHRGNIIANDNILVSGSIGIGVNSSATPGVELEVIGSVSASITSTGSFGAIHMPSTARIGFGTTQPGQAIDLRDGRIIMNNNYGYVQRDAAGNSATVMNLNGSDQLIVGDTNHCDEVVFKSANSRHYFQGNSDTAEIGLRESNNTLRFFIKYDSGIVQDSDSLLELKANNGAGSTVKLQNSKDLGVFISGSVSASGASQGAFHKKGPFSEGLHCERTTGGNSIITFKNSNDQYRMGITSTRLFAITNNADIAGEDATEFVISGSGGAGTIGMGTRTPLDNVRLTVQSTKTYQQSIQYDAGTRCLIGVADTGLVTMKSDNSAGYLWTIGTTTRFKASGSGNFHADGDVIAASTQVGSDRKLKKNIKDTPYGLDDVLQLRAVEFDWKEKRQGVHDIGVIAQEIEKIIPEVVTITEDIKDNTSYKTVDYGKLSSVLIKAVQEQQEQIKELRKDINKLRGHK